MTSTELAVRYRRYAMRCLLIEKRQFDVGERAVLVDMAKAWAGLADCVEKNEAVFALFEPED